MHTEALCGLLAEPDRLMVFSAVVLGARTRDAVAGTTGLPARRVAAALYRLERGGLVDSTDGRLVADAGEFKQAVREAFSAQPDPPLESDPARAAVLRRFIPDGRLRQVPAVHGKRRVVLEHIAATFEPGVKYPERVVDAALRAWHHDHATLRRYLVDEALMARQDGVYWRIGGQVW